LENLVHLVKEVREEQKESRELRAHLDLRDFKVHLFYELSVWN